MPPGNPELKVCARPKLAAGLAVVLLAMLACSGRFGELPDFAAIRDVDQMKHAFYRYLQPVVAEENARILAQREELQSLRETLDSGTDLGWFEKRTLKRLAREYEVEWDEGNIPEISDRLWRRVDIIPADLALVQAAKESGWGRSRFAVDYNNLFGQWCFERGCGAVPKRRRANARHEVAEFSSISQAVRRYMNNLNTHEQYLRLRQIRARRRSRNQPIDGATLAPGLDGYSERGIRYVEEVLSMLRSNRDLLDTPVAS